MFAGNVCGKCPEYERCCSSKSGNNYAITYDAKALRLRDRRRYEQTEEFHHRSRPRGGIEALFGNLKQNTPLRRLSVRGKSAVYNAVNSIMVMHNIMQAAKLYVNRNEKSPEEAIQALKSLASGLTNGIANARRTISRTLAASN